MPGCCAAHHGGWHAATQRHAVRAPRSFGGRAPGRRRAARAAGLRGRALHGRSGAAAPAACRAERRRLRGRERRRPGAHPAAGTWGDQAAVGGLCHRADLSVRHRLLAAGAGAALRLCRGDRSGCPVRLSPGRPSGTRQGAGCGRCRVRPRLGRVAWPGRRLGRRAGARQRAGVRSRRGQPAQLRHRSAQLHR